MLVTDQFLQHLVHRSLEDAFKFPKGLKATEEFRREVQSCHEILRLAAKCAFQIEYTTIATAK